MRTYITAIALLCSLLSSSVPADAQSETVATAAKKAFDQGELERAAGNHTGAVTLLKTAVRLSPENALYHHRLSKAYLDAEKYQAMWEHTHKAAFFDNKNEEYANDFMKMWLFHDREGAVNAGVSSELLLKMLGEPDKRVETEVMKRWVYGFMAVDLVQDEVFRVVDVRGYTAEAAHEPEQVKVQANPQYWAVGHHMVSRRDDNLELVPHGQVIQNWTELFSKQRFPLMSQTRATVRGMADAMHGSLQESGTLVQFEIMSETPKSITYQWRTKASEQNPAQHEIAKLIAKLIAGQKDFYRVANVKKTDVLTAAELEKWSKVIANATLIPRAADSDASTPDSGPGNLNVRLTLWELGKNLAFAALVRGRHGPDTMVKETLLHVSRKSSALEVSVPAPDPLTEDSNSDTASAIHFLLETAGKPLHSTLAAKYGEDSSALFELGIKTTLLSMLYQPGDSTSQSFAVAIESAARKANLDSQVWQPLVSGIGAKAPTDEIRHQVKTFHEHMSTL